MDVKKTLGNAAVISLLVGSAYVGFKAKEMITGSAFDKTTSTQTRTIDDRITTPTTEARRHPEEGLYLTPTSISKGNKKNLEIILTRLKAEGFTPNYHLVTNNLGKEFYRVIVETDNCTVAKDAMKLYALAPKLGFEKISRINYEQGNAKKWTQRYDTSYDKKEAKKFENLKYFQFINKASAQENLAIEIPYAIFYHESKLNPNAISSTGATGIPQFIKATAKRYGVSDRKNVEQSITGGIAYLKDLVDMFNGDLELVAGGYNFGENGVQRRAGCDYNSKKEQLKAETRKYVPITTRFHKTLADSEKKMTFTDFEKKYAATYNAVEKL